MLVVRMIDPLCFTVVLSIRRQIGKTSYYTARYLRADKQYPSQEQAIRAGIRYAIAYEHE